MKKPEPWSEESNGYSAVTHFWNQNWKKKKIQEEEEVAAAVACQLCESTTTSF